MSNRNAARAWLANAPADLVQAIRRMTWHHKVNWNAPDYVTEEEHPEGSDGRAIVDELEDAEAISSALLFDLGYNPEDPSTRTHFLAIDVDVPAWLIPTSSPGHSHLIVQIPICDGDLWDFLDAAVKIGLLEDGYVSACKSRGMTSLRAPWIRKGEEQHDQQEATDGAGPGVLCALARTPESLGDQGPAF